VTSPFVGRASEIARVHAALDRATAGAGALILFTGEAGIGKTRLAREGVRHAAEQGCRVAWGRCWEAGGAPAYWPWIELFQDLGMDNEMLRGHDPERASAAERFELFESVAAKLSNAAERSALVLVLDDLHAADAASLALLQFLARRLRDRRIAILGTYRDAEARLASDVGPVLSKIAREGEVLSLPRMSEEDIARWLVEVGMEPSAQTVADVHRVSEGNPLFVDEVLRVGGRALPGQLPDGMRAVLEEHLARVSPTTRDALGVAAVLGRTFDPTELAELASMDADTLDIALREASAAGIIEPLGERRTTFVHVLLRDHVYGSLAPSRRAALHWSAGEQRLASKGALATAVHHLIEGHGAGSLDRVLESTRRACEHSIAGLAFEQAVSLGRRALELVQSAPATRSSCEIQGLVAEGMVRSGQTQAGRTLAVDVSEAAKRLGAPDLMARAALTYGAELTSGMVDPRMTRLLRDALDALPEDDSPLRARVMARLAAAMVPPEGPDVPTIQRLGREARAMAQRIGDAHTQLYVLQFVASALGYMVSGEERYDLGKELMTLALALDQTVTIMNVGGWWTVCLLEAGQRVDAMATLDALRERSARLPQPHYQWRIKILDAMLATLDGDFERAARLGDEALELGMRAGSGPAQFSWALQRVALAHARGEPASIAPEADRVLGILMKGPRMHPYSGWILAATGRDREAKEQLRHVSVRPEQFPWLIIAADAAVILRDSELAETYSRQLAEHRFRNRVFWGPAGAFMLGPTARTLGDLALLLGRPDEAVTHYEEAVELCERIGVQPLAELSRRGLAEARRRIAPPPAPVSVPVPSTAGDARAALASLCREGELWSLRSTTGATFHLKDGKGIRYLARLLEAPGDELHVLELIGSDEAPADAGSVLDERAKTEYRRRLEDLRDQLEEARSLADIGRAERAQAEIDALADELARATGLGGRDRKAASNVERARVNVQRRLKDAIERIARHDPELRRYLESTVKTGVFCSFRPL